jgi:diguanylate cyclase (GGDEF)-like protein/PAS domain S-box-containing protein
MTFLLTPYSLVLLLTAVFTLGVGYLVWRRGFTPGGWYLLLLLVAVSEWCFAAGLQAGSVEISAKVFWAKAEYFGSFSAVPLMLFFALDFTDRKNWIGHYYLVWLWAISGVTILLAATNDLHHLVWASFKSGLPGTNLLVYGHAVWFVVPGFYVFLVVLAATMILVHTALRSRGNHRFQSILLLSAAFFPWAGSFLYFTGLNPAPGLDLMPLSFSLTGVVLAIAIFRFRLFGLVPIARDVLVEKMSDGILVLDALDRVVDINPAAQKMFAGISNSILGKRIEEVMPGWSQAVAAQVSKTQESRIELSPGEGGGSYTELQITPLFNGRGRNSGRLIVVSDISQHKQAESALHQANDQLTEKLAENQILQAKLREQSIIDPLTGLYNRLYLDETLERELARADREGYPVSVIMLDIDHFKYVNDLYGHPVGDRYLEEMGKILHAHSRVSDIVCRYGGEEFLAVFPGMPLEASVPRAEQWRAAIEKLSLHYEGQEVRATVSIGLVYCQPGSTAEEVLKTADMALYAAKDKGRNCIAVWV